MRIWVYWAWTETLTDPVERWRFLGTSSEGSVSLIDQQVKSVPPLFPRTLARGLWDFQTQFYRKWVYLS